MDPHFITIFQLSARAHEALLSKQKAYGFKRGSPRVAGAFDSKYLLTGMVECGVCGGTIVQTWTANKPAYRCWYNHSRGRAVCSNSLVVNMHLADDTVLRAVTRDVLDPEVVGEALDLSLRKLEQPATAVAARPDMLKSELVRLETELMRYTEAIADVGPLGTILQAVNVREQRRNAIRTELKTLATTRGAEPRDTSQIRAELFEYLENWRAMARQGVAEARCLLRAVLVNRFCLHARDPAARIGTTNRPGPEATVHLRGKGRGVTLRAFRGVNSRKFGGGPNGIRTRV